MSEPDTLSEYRYDWDYSEYVTLEGGSTVLLRLLRPDDREELLEGFTALSEESKYRRFLGPKTKLSERELEYLVDIDQIDHVAVGALAEGDDGELHGVGIARCVSLADHSGTAEAAVTVVDDWQGMGLGKILLDRLVEAAHERGIARFRATLFAGNRAMQNLLHGLGDARVVERDGSVVTLVVPIGDEPTAAEEEDEESTLRRILSMTGRGAASLVDKFRPPDADSEDPE